MSLYEKHKALLDQALTAIHKRKFWAAYPEHPKAYGEDFIPKGEASYKELLGKKFELPNQSSEILSWAGEENSPYTQEDLGISYPIQNVESVIGMANKALRSWRKTTPEERAGVLVEALEKIKTHFVEIAYATMHTTGQSFIMSFQASGPHSNDRALEPIALGLQELKRFPAHAEWEKPMGKFSVKLQKHFRAVPKGIGLIIGCSTFPVWNTVPGLFADLIAGNVAIVKPHPKSVLPIAIVVRDIQQVLKENGYDPDVVQLACDTTDQLITKKYCEHPSVKLIDYTGSTSFGEYVESLQDRKTVFTEKAGVNSVLLDSVDNLDQVIDNLSFSVSLYSGQMCTAPQNFFVPASGVKATDKNYSYDEVVAKLKAAITGIAENPKMGVGVLGAVQNPLTIDRVASVPKMEAGLVLEGASVSSPEFANARTSSAALMEVESDAHHIFERELFGPIAIIIKTKNTEESISKAKELAAKHGAITCAAYTTDETTRHHIEDEMSEVFVPVTFNLRGPIWVNQHAAFSDFHVTGGNPAGNASFTNPEFVVRRFVWVGSRMMD